MRKIPYNLFDNYYLRTPVRPLDYYFNFLKECNFRKLLDDKFFIEAIYLASPNLYYQALKWKEGRLKDSKKEKLLKIALLKYVARISSRCTPFGLFAACSIGEFSYKTDIEINSLNRFRRITKFDMSFLDKLFVNLSTKTGIDEHLTYFPNTSLYETVNGIRYVEYIIENDKRVYYLQEVEKSIHLKKILNKSKGGATIVDLTLEVVDEDISNFEARKFIRNLIENQILISELEISLTGESYFQRLINFFKKNINFKSVYILLKELELKISFLDKNFGNDINLYDSIFNDLKKFKIDYEKKYLLQTDTFLATTKNILDRRLKNDLYKVMYFYNKISFKKSNYFLDNFKEQFLKRYDRREIPINLALDSEFGIGYGIKRNDNNTLIDDLIFQKDLKYEQKIVWSKFDDLILKKLIKCYENETKILNLCLDDVNDYSFNWDDLPDTFSAVVEVVKEGLKDKIHIKGIGGSSAVNLLGRFSKGDIKLSRYVKNICEIEAEINSNKIIAEVIHLPQSRTGNVLHRPNFRKFEIPYLGCASVKTESIIPLEDIIVSVKNNRIILKSKKFNKEIIPRLSNAHNYNLDSLPIYSFLCDLQSQNLRSSIGFEWNVILTRNAYLPRVQLDDIILSKARWNIKTKDFLKLFKDEPLDKNYFKNKYKLPRYVELIEGDNNLLIDTINKSSVEMLIQTVKNKNNFLLNEFLFDDETIVNDRINNYCNQFIVSFYNNSKLKKEKSE